MSILNQFLYATNFAVSDISKRLNLNREKIGEVDAFSYLYAYGVARKPSSITELRNEILKSPEVLSRLLTIIDDVLPGYEIICEDEKLKEHVEEKLVETNFFRELHSAYLDFLLTGDGYLEPVYIRQKDIDVVLNNMSKIDTYKNYVQPIDFDLIKELALKQNPELYEPTSLTWLISDNVWKEFDKHGRIGGYKQIVHGQVKARWDYDQLINISAYKAKSEIYGFTPLLAFLDDLVLLKDTKLYIKNFFENNGVPDYIIGLKNGKGPKDPAYMKLQEVMKERREKKQRGSMVVSGELFVEALNQTKDMDFNMLLNYIANQLDLLWRIPPQKLSGTSSKDRNANAVLRPYYARINKEQQFVEDVLNAGYFKHFGKGDKKVKIKLNNSSSVDQVVDASWNSTMWNDGVISLEEYREHMGLARDAPKSLQENPNFKTKDEVDEFAQQQLAQKKPDPSNSGKTQDNRANPFKTPKQQAQNKHL
jgi:hypothetical protein